MKELIQKQIWLYGFLPLLLVLERYEKQENYELCQLILDVLIEHSHKYNFYIPSRYNDEAVKICKENLQNEFGLIGDTTVRNTEGYANEIMYNIDKYRSFVEGWTSTVKRYEGH